MVKATESRKLFARAAHGQSPMCARANPSGSGFAALLGQRIPLYVSLGARSSPSHLIAILGFYSLTSL